MGVGGGGSGIGAGFCASISASELERLKLSQFHHREAIYHANEEGEFAARPNSRIVAAP